MSVVKTARLSWDIAREAGASLLTYELYPLGLAGKSVPAFPRLWLKPTKRIPILFIHGVFHNPSAFAWLIQRLAFSGWHHFGEMNLYTMFHSIPTMAEKTAENIETLRERYGVDKVDVVAHSMGGIVARYFIQKLGGDGVVRNLVTLGTPHQGSTLSQMSVLPRLRELSPGSSTLRELNQKPVPKKTQCLSISGALDIVIQPRDHAFWPGVRNIRLKGVGHAGLLFSRRVAKLIIGRLK
jgi:triacylglycerol lipase